MSNIESPIFHAKFSVDAHCIKKNQKQIFINRGTGKPFITSNSRSKGLETELVRKLRRAFIDHKLSEPFRIPMRLVLLFGIKDYFTKKGLVSRKLPDLSNLYEGPQDALQKAHVIEDDHFIYSHDGSRRLPAQENYLEIFLYLFKE